MNWFRSWRNRSLLATLAVCVVTASCSHGTKYYVDKGRKLDDGRKHAEAALNYRKAIQIDPQNGEAYYQLGLADLQLKDGPEAYQALLRAVDLLPARDDIKVLLADLSFTAMVRSRQPPKPLYDLVAKLSDQLLTRNPQSYDGWRLKGSLAVAERKFKLADEFFRKANEAKPMEPGLILSWVGVLFEDGRPGEGERLALQLIAQRKDYGPIYDELFRQYVLLRKFNQAEGVLKSKVANNPKDGAAILQLAKFYARTSRKPEMEAVLQRMLDHPADFPKAHLDVGDFYAGLTRWGDAIQQYQQGAQADSKDKAKYWKRIAEAWLLQGKLDQASQIVDAIVREHPSDDEARAVQASLLLASGTPEKVEQAVSQFRALVKKAPDNAVWRFALGRALMAKGDSAAARTEFQESIRLRNDLIPPRMLLADLSQSSGDYQTALRYDNEILAIHPDLDPIRLQRAVSLIRTDHDAEARNELQSLKRTFPRQVQLQYALLDLKHRNFGQAEDEFRRLLREGSLDIPVISGLVDTYREQGQFERAVSLLTDALAKNPQANMVRAMLADTALQAGKPDLAIAVYRDLLAVRPRTPQFYLGVAAAYRSKGDVVNAVANVRQALALAPRDAGLLVTLADVLAASGNRREAEETYRRAVALQPDNAAALNGLAFLLADSGGNLEEAEDLTQEALRLAPKQPNVFDTQGWIYLKRNLTDSALRIFQDLARRYPEEAEFRYHLGLTMLQKHQMSAAQVEFRAALADKPSAEVRQNVQAALAKIP